MLSVSGIGAILGLTILLETGGIGRFAQVGQYASHYYILRDRVPFDVNKAFA